MRGRKYEDERGRTVTVMDVDGEIAILNNGTRVAIGRLNDPKYYRPIASSANKINESNNMGSGDEIMTNISTSPISNDESRYEAMLKNMKTEGNNKSSFNLSIGEDETTNFVGNMRGEQSAIRVDNNVVESHNRHMKVMGQEIPEEPVPTQRRPTQSNLTEEEKLLAKYGHDTNPQPNNPPKKDKEDVTGLTLEEIASGKRTTARESNRPVDNTPPEFSEDPIKQQEQQAANSIHKVFDSVKKVHQIKLNLKIDEKIPDKDMIKMFEENFPDESAIDYYTTDIYNKLMSDPSIIEDQVRSAIEKYVRSRGPRKSNK